MPCFIGVTCYVSYGMAQDPKCSKDLNNFDDDPEARVEPTNSNAYAITWHFRRLLLFT